MMAELKTAGEAESGVFPFITEHLHVSRLDADWAYPAHAHSFYQLYCLLDGQVEYTFGDTHVLLRPGEALLIPPGMRRSLRSQAPAGRSLVILFRIRSRDFRAERTLFVLPAPARVSAESLAGVCEAGPEVRPLQFIRVNAFLLELFGTKFFARYCADWIARWSGGETRIKRVVEYAESLMRANTEHPLPLDTLARLTAVSRAGLERAFREVRRSPVIRRYREIRLEEARDLLCCGSSITDAARRTGFATSQHFATAFRRRFRCVPSQFQKVLP